MLNTQPMNDETLAAIRAWWMEHVQWRDPETGEMLLPDRGGNWLPPEQSRAMRRLLAEVDWLRAENAE